MDTTADAITNQQATTNNSAQAITPDVVRQIADRVYALLQNDLRLERERLGLRYRRNTVPRRR